MARRFRVSLGMVKKLLQQRRHHGDIRPRHHLAGRKPLIVAEHRDKMDLLLKKKPDLSLKELREALGLKCSLQAIHVVLVKMEMTLKKRLSAPASKTARTSPGHRPTASELAAPASPPGPGAAGLPRRVGSQDEHDPALGPGPSRAARPR